VCAFVLVVFGAVFTCAQMEEQVRKLTVHGADHGMYERAAQLLADEVCWRATRVIAAPHAVRPPAKLSNPLLARLLVQQLAPINGTAALAGSHRRSDLRMRSVGSG
jgi:hypothetical protein